MQISVIPLLWVIAIGLAGTGSYAGIFAHSPRHVIAGWLIFIVGAGMMIATIELLIAGYE